MTLEQKERPLAGETAATLDNPMDYIYPGSAKKSNGGELVPAVFVRDGKVFANSQDVAAFFKKKHHSITHDIDALIDKTPAIAGEFQAEEHKLPHMGRRPLRGFDMTRRGFEVWSKKFTWGDYARMTRQYLAAFGQESAEPQADAEPANDGGRDLVPAGELIPFEFEGRPVRVVTIEGEAWFVAADVCAILEHGNPRQVVSRLDDDEKGVHTMDTPGGQQKVTVINEGGLYSLILTSRKESAKRFKKWITGEILPSIRKTGGYMVAAPDETPEQLTLRAMTVLSATVERQKAQLAAAGHRAEVAESRVAAAMADVRVNNRIAKLGGSKCIRDTAKALDVKECDLFAYLHAQKWIYRRNGSGPWLAYDDKRDKGLLKHKEVPLTRRDGTEIWVTGVVVTPEGLQQLGREIEGAGMAPGIRLVSDQQELDLKAESKLAIAAPADPHKARGRIPGSKNRWTVAGASDWLAPLLDNGPKGSIELRRLAKEADISWRTVGRAADALGVRRESQPGVTSTAHAGSPEKVWRLPAKEDPIQTKGDASPNNEGQGHDQPQVQNKQGKPGGWLSRFIGG